MMNIVLLSRYVLSISIAAVFLVGCGGPQPLVGAPRPMLRAPQIASRASSAYSVLYQFTRAIDGHYPVAPLIDANGTLYGTTEEGGGRGKCSSGGCGTVYSVSTTGAEAVLHSFGNGAGGSMPQAGLVDVDGTLYGTTAGGGLGWGTVFRVSTSGSERVLYKFQGGTDGSYPKAGLIYANGLLYGTTFAGGSGSAGCQSGCGTVFSVSLSGKETVMHSFTGGQYDGAEPVAGLIEVNGTLYGTTHTGGAPINSQGCCGTVYSISKSGEETVLYRFIGGADGEFPDAGLTDVNGTLYGTTASGGACDPRGCGTAYSVTLQGKENVLYRFFCGSCSGTGQNPVAGLVAVNGTLYGTTRDGGSGNCGTLYGMSTSGTVQVLHSFTGGTDGCFSEAALINVSETLYGTTSSAYKRRRGSAGPGTIFGLTL